MITKPFVAKRSNQVAEYLESLITQNVYRPGDKLPSLQEMAALLKVSKSTIREALAALVAQDLIDVRHGKGYFIKQNAAPSQEPILVRDLGEVLFVRILLEVPAAKLAAQNRTADHLVLLKQSLEAMHTAEKEEGMKADLRFHLMIGEATQNAVLQDVIQSLAPLMQETMKFSRAIAGTHSTLYHKHLDLYNAIMEKDSLRATQFMYDHLNDTAQRLKILVPEAWAIEPKLDMNVKPLINGVPKTPPKNL
ncbi:MAG: FadR/GntR family transcriptional regulator [Sulfobacillus sp.]